MSRNVIKVNAKSKSYEITVGEDTLFLLPEILDRVAPKASIALFSDSNVYALYGKRAEELLDSAGREHSSFVIPAGEGSKTPETLFSFLEFMADNGFTRSDCVVALGGGVVGDVGGFAASIYQRGIKVVQIPTTVLAMSDSSVGGKTAVDLKAGKNLAGTFWQPDAVICDLSLSKTLPQNIFRDGCAEIIKYGVIIDAEMFERLESGIDSCFEYAVTRSIEIKRDIVEADENDKGVRGLLNFGHTLGHAVEKLSGYGISHGSAVAIGMVAACRIAAKIGLCDITDRVNGLLVSYGFDTAMPYSAEQLSSALRSDKKRSGDSITLILPEKLGKCILYPTTLKEVDRLLSETEM